MINLKNTGLYTDFYELTMAQGYFLNGMHKKQATFDYFYRKNPFHGGYVVFAGLSDFLDELEAFQFGQDALNYLKAKGFQDSFLEYLADFRFRGDIYSCKEGEIVFPLEPILRVDGNIVEAQLIESMLLNILNFTSLIATKAVRIRHEAGERKFADFGLRRAQGLGSVYASKASIIGGANSTSNVFAGAEYDIPLSGTMAHSWVQSFDTEIEAFRSYASIYPNSCILLIDTYDTINIGLKNAITIAKELEEKGHKLIGVRLDSGDLAYLSKEVRKILDQQGLEYVNIVASNQLDEYLIRSLNLQKAPIDVFGVGTRLITGATDAALDGVYKMSEYDGESRLKISDNITKLSLPGKKNVIRYFNSVNQFYADAVILEDEKDIHEMIHPHYKDKRCRLLDMDYETLLLPVMIQGERKIKSQNTEEIAEFVQDRLLGLDGSITRLENPHIYKVGLSDKLMKLRDSIAFEKQNNGG
ncbi:MAG: nicotinate phosphoribosyltransferase [Bacteroidales bacterium]|nr:nicotinate phosphoribosyltransferase [Bacteroidales bacterium]MCF8327076.1 nicotinate phosphoribosyltransferase [Bacteroidales bacterium]